MSYGLIGLGKGMEQDAMQGLGDLANQQARQKQANDAMETAEKQQQMSSIGMGAGMGAMAGAQMGAVGGPMGMAIGAGVSYLASEVF